MRRVVAMIVLFVVHVALLASGTNIAYSEAVPPRLVAARQAVENQQTAAHSQQAQGAVQEFARPSASVVSANATEYSTAITGDSLHISSIGFVAPVVNIGVTATNNIDVPSGPQVGYWTGSAVPGMAGAVFLDGHNDGVFKNLHKLDVGQTVSLHYGGQTFTYRVIHKETVPLDGIDMGRALRTYGSALEGLNMMTCAGNYVPSQGTYDHRLVVYAVRV